MITAELRPDAATCASVVRRVAREEGVSPEVASRWFEEMMKFLELLARARVEGDERLLSPSPLVDKAWHAFILHTPQYTAFCEQHAGGYLHHEVTDPGADPAQALMAYLLTRERLKKRFGGIDEEIWPA